MNQETPPRPDSYTYKTAWSHEDQQFISTVAEFPDLRWAAKSPETAEAGLMAVVHETLLDLHRSGGIPPQPIPRPVAWQQQPPAPSYHQAPPMMQPQPQFQMPQYATAPAQGVNQSVNVVVGGGYRPFYRRSGIGAGWHIIHATGTVLTCGIWGIVWIAHIVIDSNQNKRRPM